MHVIVGTILLTICFLKMVSFFFYANNLLDFNYKINSFDFKSYGFIIRSFLLKNNSFSHFPRLGLNCSI